MPRASSSQSRWSSTRGHFSPPVQPSAAPPYGPLLVKIDRDELQESLNNPQITNCVDVASYSWLARAEPTIIVPGEPARWTPFPTGQRLSPDRGDYLRDPNAVRSPNFPWDPACQAIWRQHPFFDSGAVDIVTCSSVLGNLSRYVRGMDRDFRFVMDRVGSTVFFVRRENSPTERIPDVRGYGHTFLDEYTSWGSGLGDSESHQRIVQYDFGDRHYLVRFESDGYIAEREPSPGKTQQIADIDIDIEIDRLAAALNIGTSVQRMATGRLHEEGFMSKKVGIPWPRAP